jgi:DNA mismatch repair ATPase MutS
MSWSGFKLFTSMRNKDDINTSSSYFYSELKRLKLIIDTIEKKSDIIVLLDEILKGTNSIDKQEGSAKYLLKIKRLGAKGVIATHDLKLCELENEYFENNCFDSEINDDQLHFDYIIRKGICKNMNASFLMKKMNLIDE